MFYTEAISLVRKKLSFLQAEEAKASNAAQKFEIRQQIEEANQRLFELQEASSGSCNIKIASSRLFRGMNQGSELLIGREDNLAALRILDKEAQQQREATTSAEESLQLFTNRYQGGVDN